MEFPNLHPQPQLIQQQLASENHSSTILPTSSDLNSTTSLNDNANNTCQEKYFPNLGEFRSNHAFVDYSPENPIAPFFGDTCQKANEHVPSELREESSVTFPSFSEMLCSPSNVEELRLLSSSTYKQQLSLDGTTNPWLSNLSMGCLSTQGSYIDAQNTTSSRGFNASHLFPPGTTIPASDMPSPLFSSPLGLNLQTLDFLATKDYSSGSSSQFFYDSHSLFRDSMRCSSLENLHASRDVPLYRSITNQPVFNGATTAKRATNISGAKISNAEAKKPRSSCPPLKVRKEKLGDRIAALQRLVSPFGKTDTASVLTEAIGYIQFLHDQIQTLSVPYMKSSHQGCPSRTVGQKGPVMEDGREESKRDLKSRGLCLVPLSCASYVNNYE